MPVQRVETDEVQRLVADGAQLIEVLPATEFAREHLPGARSIPMAELTPESVASLDRERPVIAYCYDHECDLSARAAALLQAYGFDDVYDYRASKTAWLGAGLPSEGSVPTRDRAGTLADRSVPTCHPDDDTATLAARFGEGSDTCVVIDEHRIVLGLLDRRVLAVRGVTAASVMSTAPTSVRPSILRHELAASMDRSGERQVLVTTSGGELIGVVRRERLDRA